MALFTEHEVAVAAAFMGYDLWRVPEGYVLMRERDRNQEEIIAASSLERIADYLKH
jgi:hypothetical protein